MRNWIYFVLTEILQVSLNEVCCFIVVIFNANRITSVAIIDFPESSMSTVIKLTWLILFPNDVSTSDI